MKNHQEGSDVIDAGAPAPNFADHLDAWLAGCEFIFMAWIIPGFAVVGFATIVYRIAHPEVLH